MNGDGYADVIVGAYGNDDAAGTAGEAYVYYGSASGLSATPDWSDQGESAADYLLARLALFFVIDDVWFYFYHRTLHTVPSLYIRFHKPHHVFTAPFAATSHAPPPVAMLLQGVGGMLGILLTSFFAATVLDGLGLEGSMGHQLWIQAVGVGATAVWSGLLTYLILIFVRAVLGLRVSEDEESKGLDLTYHGERGYNLD